MIGGRTAFCHGQPSLIVATMHCIRCPADGRRNVVVLPEKLVSGPASGASEHTILVATTRERDPRPGTLFNGNRSGTLA
jgi:hypothetical protein